VDITLRAPQVDNQQHADIDRFDLPDVIVVGRVVNAAKTRRQIDGIVSELAGNPESLRTRYRRSNHGTCHGCSRQKATGLISFKVFFSIALFGFSFFIPKLINKFKGDT
jgi:hypothetical protein